MKASSAASLGWRMLRKVKVRAAVDRRRAERFQALQMEGDEALALISMRARADLAEAMDERGRLLPFHQWPESLRLACRTRSDKDGNVEWQFPDGLKASELMAVATGKLKTNVLQVTFDHASYLAGLDDPPPDELGARRRRTTAARAGMLSVTVESPTGIDREHPAVRWSRSGARRGARGDAGGGRPRIIACSRAPRDPFPIPRRTR